MFFISIMKYMSLNVFPAFKFVVKLNIKKIQQSGVRCTVATFNDAVQSKY